MPDDEEFRPGAHDLETPFLFVPHGAPDPVEFKRQYPGWVSFPATFVPHLRPIPKWKIINGQRWPLDKKGRPWPKTRYGRPTCPFDELPEGFPAPGTQHELLRKLENPTLFWDGEPTPTVAEILAIGERSRAERAAAAPPPPMEPPRAYDGDGLGPARDYLVAMAGVNASMRQAAEDAAFWSAAPSERLRMSDDVLNRNGAAVLAATRKAGSQPIRIAAMDGQPGETAGPTAVQLPPGAYHEPLVPLMNRLLAVREGDDVAALRREVSEAFYAHGDTIGGNQVNMYLSELAEPGVTEAHRREIAAALAHYAKADPEEMGLLRKDMVGGVLAGGGTALERFLARRRAAPASVAAPPPLARPTAAPGRLIGSLQGLTPAERSFAQEMVASGRIVEIVPTSHQRTADFVIDGVQTELKTLSGVGNQTSDGLSKQISSRILDARGQSTTIVVDARAQAGVTKRIGERGIERALGADARQGDKLRDITVLTPDGIARFRR